MRYSILGLFLFVIGIHLAYADVTTPIGYWKTIDDVSGNPKSIVKIWKNSDNTLSGQVVKVFAKKGEDPNKLCTACKGDKHNQPVVGMIILNGLKFNESQWEKGSILDPSNGKTYHCALRPVDQGKKLHVRGYVGLPLLGRSQTWLRINPHSAV